MCDKPDSLPTNEDQTDGYSGIIEHLTLQFSLIMTS